MEEIASNRAPEASARGDVHVHPPLVGDEWLGWSSESLPVDRASAWVVQPDCGGVVVFTGTARDHAEGRTGVVSLEYEAYESQVVPTFERIVQELRSTWPEVGRVVVLHRVGSLAVGDAAVVVAVSAPHRAAAFEAARFGIDAVKARAPIWKRERWAHGEDWGTGAVPPVRKLRASGATMEAS